MASHRLVVLGTGFGAFNLVRRLGDEYAVTIISPRNHFLFTPLLPSTTVGTLEFRSIIEPIRHARKNSSFLHANATALDAGRRIITCEAAVGRHTFTVAYDILVIAVGAVSNTFGVPGVAEHALFLKELGDARLVRQRIVTNIERANLPGLDAVDRERLLRFVICGGGPTGVEFAAELHDFLMEDMRSSYPALVADARIILVEAGSEILNTFDEKLRAYARDLFARERVSVLTGSPVVSVDEWSVTLADGFKIPYGLLVWSTGIGPTSFVQQLLLPKDRKARLLVDDFFHVRGYTDIFALGDCSVLESGELPATSQVAQQQGKYLATALMAHARGESVEPFRYRHLGMLAYIGRNRALADLQNFKGRGWTTWIFWRSAYLSRIVSVKNKILVMFDWIKARIFGRDISQF
jgi:NADH:ubiquinone reductase (non-electrogenic)